MKNIWKLASSAVVLITLVIALPACTREIGVSELTGYVGPRFSPDGNFLAFDLCDKKQCNSVIYDIAAQTYIAFVDLEGRRINKLTFSPDGKTVAFMVWAKDEWPWQKTFPQIAVGTLDEKTFRVVTDMKGYMLSHAFWNEDSVLFWGITGASGSFKGNRNLYIVNVNGKHTQKVMPQKFYFFGPNAPRPMGDGDHIVTSDFGFVQPEVTYEQKENIDKRSEVLLLSRSRQTVTPLATGLQDSSEPVVALKTGQLFFKGRLESNEGQSGYAYEVYVRDKEGVRRITRLRTYMAHIDVTADGKMLALVISTADRKPTNGKLLIYDVQAHAYRDLIPKDIARVSVHIKN